MAKNQQATLSMKAGVGAVQLPSYPNWYTLPQRPIVWIQADHRVETDIDETTGVGRVRLKPGYSANVEDIRYGF